MISSLLTGKMKKAREVTCSSLISNARAQVASPQSMPVLLEHTAFLSQLFYFWGHLTLSSEFLLSPFPKREVTVKRSGPSQLVYPPSAVLQQANSWGAVSLGKEDHTLISPFSWGHRQKERRGCGILVTAVPCIRLLFPRTHWLLPNHIYISWTHTNT